MRKLRSRAQCLSITMLALIGLISGNTLPVAVQSTTVSAQSAPDDLLTQSSTPGANGKIAFASQQQILDIYVINADGSSRINLTNNRGLNYTPAWSPDGARIAFASSRDGNGEIYVMNADGSNPTRLTNDPANDAEPTWSPDGAKIAFTRQQVDLISYNAEIYVMNADGSNLSRLTNSRLNNTPGGYSHEPTWSPKDGTRIAFTSDRDGNGQQIYLMNADGSNQTRLPNSQAYDSLPDWSPDGARIAFTRGDIYVMNADGSNQTKLTNSGSDAGPAWSPDGARITFASARDSFGFDNSEYSGIYVMNADGSNQRRLTNEVDFDPDWSPDGARIAFTSFRIINDEIFVVNADGSNQTNLTNNPASDSDPDWSPDGTRIAFTTIRGGNPAIYVMNADGSNQRRLTNFPADATSSGPAWSPDGARIAFASTRNSIRQSIYVMNADGSNPTRLTNELAYDAEPVWSPDGARIAFSREGTGIYVMNADGSNQTKLTNSGSGSPDWSPNGTRIVFACAGDICVMNPDGSKQVNLTKSHAVGDGGPAWSPDGTRIVFTSGYEIYVMSADGSNQTRVVINPGGYYPRELAWQALPATNSIDDGRIFVRQHYLDFLNREPDQAGWDYWTNEITRCGTDASCIHSRRIGVSAAFFIESEFQDTGYYVYRFYKASFGRQPSFAEFMSDRSQVVAGANLEAGRQAFAEQWVQRPAFQQAFSNTMSNTEFVKKLFDTAGLTAPRFDAQRQQEIVAMNAGRSRALVLRDVIEIPDFKNVPNPQDPRYVEIKQVSQYNPAFVLMQYFGYLRRNVDQNGFDFWLDVVNNREPNDYRGMVCAFITSTEYQLRFGSVVTRSNADCSQ